MAQVLDRGVLDEIGCIVVVVEPEIAHVDNLSDALARINSMAMARSPQIFDAGIEIVQTALTYQEDIGSFDDTTEAAQ